MMDDNETYNNQETKILIKDWLEEEPDEYWQEIEER